ncbi:MAG: hypothetical protein H6Q66_2778 [Firmicutes bacterium]|nr:hypothetical protein [Bacillota bacterium]
MIVAFVLVFTGFFLSNSMAPYISRIYYSTQYLGIHTLLELLSVFIVFSIFSMVLLMRDGLKEYHGKFLLRVGLGFLAVGGIDLLHALSYPGMPEIITASSFQKAIALWIFGKYLVAVLFLSAFVRHQWENYNSPYLSQITWAINLAVIGIALLLAGPYLPLIPPLYIEGQGLTPLKIQLEYGVVFLYALICLALLRSRERMKESVRDHLISFIVFSIGSEIAFSVYRDYADTYNLLGHIYKIVAYYYLFKAVYMAGIVTHFYILSEMAKMSADLLRGQHTIPEILDIQMKKLRELVPHLERITVYYKRSEDLYEVLYNWGKYAEKFPVGRILYVQNPLKTFGKELKVLRRPGSLLLSLGFGDPESELRAYVDKISESLYIPLMTAGETHGFVLAHLFNPSQPLSVEDVEKVTVFQQFSSLALDQAKSREKITQLSYEDSLTGLPNRRLFFQALEDIYYEANRYGTGFGVVSLDMNRLKYLNDQFGHEAGDAALRLVGSQIRSHIRQNDVPARLGGDEFAIVFRHMDRKAVQAKAMELQEAFSEIALPGYDGQKVSMAIGLAAYPDDATDMDSLLRLADDRMYANKRRMHEEFEEKKKKDFCKED